MMYSLLIFCYMFFTCSFSLFFFFFNDTATTEIYTLSLHDALPIAWLAEFPLERVVELHVAGVVEDNDLQGPWIAPAAPSDEMLDFMALAVSRCPRAQAVTFDAFSPSLTPEVLLSSVERIRQSL